MIFRRILPLLLISLLSSCITIEEHYNFKRNGSGSMEYVVDLSAMGALLDDLGEMGKSSNSGDKAPMDTWNMEGHATALKAIPGIGKVKMVKKDKKGYIRVLSFSFKDIDALNSALNVIHEDSSGTRTDFFRWDGNTLIRSNNAAQKEMGEVFSEGNDEDTEGAQAMLSSMKYRYFFTFADKVAASTLHPEMIAGEANTKQVNASTDFSKLSNDGSVLDLRITLDR